MDLAWEAGTTGIQVHIQDDTFTDVHRIYCMTVIPINGTLIIIIIIEGLSLLQSIPRHIKLFLFVLCSRVYIVIYRTHIDIYSILN